MRLTKASFMFILFINLCLNIYNFCITQMFRELLGSDDVEEEEFRPKKKELPSSKKAPIDQSLWKENKRGRKKKHPFVK